MFPANRPFCIFLFISKKISDFFVLLPPKLNTIIVDKKVQIQSIAQSDMVGLYSILFEGNDENEFRNFMRRFRDNATLNTDFKAIVSAIDRIIAHGALERYFRVEGKMNDRVTALA